MTRPRATPARSTMLSQSTNQTGPNGPAARRRPGAQPQPNIPAGRPNQAARPDSCGVQTAERSGPGSWAAEADLARPRCRRQDAPGRSATPVPHRCGSFPRRNNTGWAPRPPERHLRGTGAVAGTRRRRRGTDAADRPGRRWAPVRSTAGVAEGRESATRPGSDGGSGSGIGESEVCSVSAAGEGL